MRLSAGALLRFSTSQITTLVVVLYAAVFINVLNFDNLPSIPRDTKGLNLETAYAALNKVTLRPRPFISHANDEVRAYILDRLSPLAAKHEHVHLSNDLNSNVTFSPSRNYTVYFEANNVLLKIDGTHPSSDGVLFSCHFDSVSTAPGATDDGMGLATLLELSEFYSRQRPRRTAIFFFNNGEEDFLNGAHAFYEHPWSNLTSTFVNLEGAASGGRPLVFRSTGYGAARSVAGNGVTHPHGNSLTSDAFSLGFIRSATDYEIYARGLKGKIPGMQGVDFAFYKNRAYYHTPRDSIAGMGEGQGRKALWAMMETTLGVGDAMLNDATPSVDARPSVYLDLFGRTLLIVPMSALYAFNVVLLVVGPIVLIALIAWVMLVAKEQSTEEFAPHYQGARGKLKLVVKAVAGWERFWIALVICALVHAGVITGFLCLNPLIVHSRAYAVMTAFLAISYLTLVTPLQVLHYLIPPTFVSQKLAVIISLSAFSWLLLLASTVAIARLSIGSLYLATFLYLGAWLAGILELLRAVGRRDPGNELGHRSELFTSPTEQNASLEGEVPSRRQVHGVMYTAPTAEDHSADQIQDGQEVETDPTEITPLMHQHRRTTQGGHEYITLDAPGSLKSTNQPAEEYGWWILQLIFLVPMNAIVLFQLETLLLNAMMHTLVDGSPALTLYLMLAVFSSLTFVPIMPFAHKLSRSLNTILFALFIVLVFVCWTAFPFTLEWPFRVYFQQSVELTPSSGYSSGTSIVRASTALTGLDGYINRFITPTIPSSHTSENNLTCDPQGLRPDLMTCSWFTDLYPSPGNSTLSLLPHPNHKYLDVHTSRLNDTRALIRVRGTNTRGCRLYLDRPITFFHVHPRDRRAPATPSPWGTMRMQGGYEIPAGGIREARLWSREWGQEFVVEVGWESDDALPNDGAITGRAACEYAEYASAGVGVPEGSGRIPAFEEVKAFLPLWALPTKTADGLAEVWMRFST
ncbi:uncharacterized protein BXZ73DRAFT_45516 [Epithele typhae]|uniref:uncharacterized protein n=1 Tax=Epithele typhae TaxID=378194 RepID=UPI002007E1F1|nr:uncharacterized protein BXZ73DRAFT_45516 [Epithele typhae]KAH9935103.1 hypothetical protein BXZ73DRAFT_45516 [Epithele typhae]